MARQVIKFTEDIDRLDREKRAKEKEILALKKDMFENYVPKQEVDQLHQVISQLKAAMQFQHEEAEAAKKSSKFLEDKLVKITAEKEMYLTEVLRQKEKQVEFMD